MHRVPERMPRGSCASVLLLRVIVLRVRTDPSSCIVWLRLPRVQIRMPVLPWADLATQSRWHRDTSTSWMHRPGGAHTLQRTF
jgi:hypothetical protein